MGYCNAEDRDLGICPYLKAIGEIAKLVAENGKYEDSQEKLKAWIADYKQRDGFDMVLLKEVVDILVIVLFMQILTFLLVDILNMSLIDFKGEINGLYSTNGFIY